MLDYAARDAAGARATFKSGGAALARAALGFAAPLDDGDRIISHRAAVVSFLVLGILISLQAQLSVGIFSKDFRCFRNGLPKTDFAAWVFSNDGLLIVPKFLAWILLATQRRIGSSSVDGFGRLRVS